MMYHWEEVGGGRKEKGRENREGRREVGKEDRLEITSIITLELSKNASYQFLPQT